MDAIVGVLASVLTFLAGIAVERLANRRRKRRRIRASHGLYKRLIDRMDSRHRKATGQQEATDTERILLESREYVETQRAELWESIKGTVPSQYHALLDAIHWCVHMALSDIEIDGHSTHGRLEEMPLRCAIETAHLLYDIEEGDRG